MADIQNPAVQRSVQILDWLANRANQNNAHAPSNTMATITRELGLPKSSVHNLLQSLVSLDLVLKQADGSFCIGPKVLHWASAYQSQNDLIASFQSIADQYPQLRQETIMLAVLNGSQVLYLACRAGLRPLGVTFKVGGHFPAYCTSTGKAILATHSNEQALSLVGKGPYAALTSKTITSGKDLVCELDSVRKNGFALDDEETAIGMHCFGAPVFQANQGHACAAVAVSLIKASTSPEQRKQTIGAIGQLASDLSKRLGFNPTSKLAR